MLTQLLLVIFPESANSLQELGAILPFAFVPDSVKTLFELLLQGVLQDLLNWDITIRALAFLRQAADVGASIFDWVSQQMDEPGFRWRLAAVNTWLSKVFAVSRIICLHVRGRLPGQPNYQHKTIWL